MPKQKHSTKVPTHMEDVYDSITALTDPFCKKHLNDDYQTLACYAAAALCRKRPSPLNTGKINTWGCAILYALGTINFLFDKSTTPYMSAENLASEFQISKSTAGSKAKKVRELLSMHRLEHHWCLPGEIDNTSFVWMITFNGFIIDARTLPRDVQIAAYEKGLIPYIHADKNQQNLRNKPHFVLVTK